MKKIKTILLLVTLINFSSCIPEEKQCKTETVCYGDGNCIEKPIADTCL